MANIRKLKFGLKCSIFLLILILCKYYYLDNAEEPNQKIETDNRNLFDSKIKTTTTEITESNVTTQIPPEISDQLETQKIVKVIILSVNPRSGSTYLSEILASSPMTSMWQEPLRFLYEHPPIEKLEFKNCIGCSVLHTEKPNVIPKDRRYRKSVPAGEKLQMISDFMNCNFQNYLELFESQVSRQFVFKLPDPALGYFKGRLTPLMISKVFLPKTINECQKSRLRIIKTIRLELQELIEVVMDRLPNQFRF